MRVGVALSASGSGSVLCVLIRHIASVICKEQIRVQNAGEPNGMRVGIALRVFALDIHEKRNAISKIH
jgi:hypothetical protein